MKLKCIKGRPNYCQRGMYTNVVDTFIKEVSDPDIVSPELISILCPTSEKQLIDVTFEELKGE